MQRLITIIITSAGLAACDPVGKNAGEVESTESGGDASGTTGGASADGEETQTDGTTPEVEVEWTLSLDPNLTITHLLPTPQGVLVALRSNPGAPAPFAEVREYSSAMDLLWSTPLPSARIGDLEVLGGGEFLAVGGWGDPGEVVPTAWRLSCCAAAVSQSLPRDPDQAWIPAAELRDDGILLVIQRSNDGTQTAELVQVPLALGPETTVELLPTSIHDAARTADGNVLLRGDGELDSMTYFYEVGPGGVGGGFSLGGAYGMIGKGDELTLVSFGLDAVALQPLGGNAWTQVPIPGFVNDGAFVLDRHTRVALVHREGDAVGPSTLVLTEFDDAGVVARSLAIPHAQYEHADARALAVGEDDAIYLAVGESEVGVGGAELLLRIAPLE